jgi:protein ImuA
MLSKPSPDRARRLALLRRLKESLPAGTLSEPAARPVPVGYAAMEAALPRAGLDRGVLHEVAPAAEGDRPAALGFLAALSACGLAGAEGPALLVASAGSLGPARLDGHGLNALGLDPGRLVLVGAEADEEAFWVLEEALRSRALAVVAGVLASGIDLKASRRLLLAAAGSGALCLALRPAGAEEINGTATRWRVRSAPAGRDRFGCFAGVRWHLSLDRCRNGRPSDWIVEWDHEARGFRLAEGLADRALDERPGEGELPERRAG